MNIDKALKKEIRDFLKSFDVKVHFIKKGWSSAISSIGLIELDIRECPNLDKTWSLIFHELSHIICYREGIYKIYHHENISEKKFAKYIRKYGLRVERFVDKMGMKLMSTYLPDLEYKQTYLSEEDVKWYKKWVERNYPL